MGVALHAVARGDEELPEEIALLVQGVREDGVGLRVDVPPIRDAVVLAGRDDGVVDELVDGIKDVGVIFVGADGAGLGVPLAHGAVTTSTSTDAVT